MERKALKLFPSHLLFTDNNFFVDKDYDLL